MQLRPGTTNDLDQFTEIDGTVESLRYLHLTRTGEGFCLHWSLEDRPLREKLILPNRLDDETRFATRQILLGADEGLVTVAEHDDAVVALLVARPDPAAAVMNLLDLRVDYDHRRQGLATAMLYQLIQSAREQDFRAVSATTVTNNHPACQLLQKCGFELAGLNTHQRTNHDLVKEQVSLLWYAAFD